MLKKPLPRAVKGRTNEYFLPPKHFTLNDSRLTDGFETVWRWLRLDLALGHDGRGATSFATFVDPAINNLHALEIFLDDFFPGEFDILFCLSAGPFANSVDHVFFHQNPNLLGQVGAGREFRHPLADNLSFRHVPLTVADQIVIA
jgi:hypothetical protein